MQTQPSEPVLDICGLTFSYLNCLGIIVTQRFIIEVEKSF